MRDTIRRLGLLQIDCVNVVCAAHYMVPFSRLGPYDRSAFDKLVPAPNLLNRDREGVAV